MRGEGWQGREERGGGGEGARGREGRRLELRMKKKVINNATVPQIRPHGRLRAETTGRKSQGKALKESN